MLYNNLTNNQYYLAKVYQAMGEEERYQIHMQQALELYERKINMFDPYTHPMDKVFFSQIKKER